MLELNIKDLRKNALIKFSGAPEGHIFEVREQTQGDRLKLAEIGKKRNKLFLEATTIQKKYLDLPKEEQDKLDPKVIEAETDAIIKKIEKLDEEELYVNASVFDDGLDQKLSIALYNELSEEERERLIKAVIKQESITGNGETNAA